MKRNSVILIFLLVISFASCRKIETLPPEPMVDFRSFTVFDSIDPLGNNIRCGRLSFYFEDGDGDLGMDAPPDSSYLASNLFLSLYRKVNGEFTLAGSSDPLYPSGFRIPYMETPGQNKIMKGTIDLTLLYYSFNTTDTLCYEFWIVDRNWHHSIPDKTCTIVLGEEGTCTSE